MDGRVIPRELKVASVPGISEKQIGEHYNVLYKGYVNKINEIRDAIGSADLAAGNPTYSQIRELKREEVFAANGVRLHEAYFESLSLNGTTEAGGTIGEWLSDDFGSAQSWAAEFRACGMSARGWVVLAYDMQDGKLHNYLSDIHSEGVWGCVPLLVLDVYEHAYFIDYATARAKYLDAFFANIDWQSVNNMIQSMGLDKVRQQSA